MHLARGRELLRERLARRGLAPGVGLAAANPIPAALVNTTIQTACCGTAGQPASASAAALAQGVLKAMAFARLKMAAGTLLTTVAVATGVLAAQRGAKPPRPPAAERPAPLAAPGPGTRGGGPKGDTQAELKKFQGLWQHVPGGMEHQDGEQVVRGPAPGGPCFFIRGDKLVWLDKEGKPSGEEETVTLDRAADPKRIKFTTKGAGGKERVLREGIYKWERLPAARAGGAAADVLTIHVALKGGPVPKRFLELNKPVKGVDGREWLVSRYKLQGK
jgi:RNA polymerase sigma-70 factor (ECF subfamily)